MYIQEKDIKTVYMKLVVSGVVSTFNLEKFKDSSEADECEEGYQKVLKGGLLKTTNRACENLKI